VRSNKAVQRAVRQALLQKKLPLSFKAKGKGADAGGLGGTKCDQLTYIIYIYVMVYDISIRIYNGL
jgi:hypothetical protein